MNETFPLLVSFNTMKDEFSIDTWFVNRKGRTSLLCDRIVGEWVDYEWFGSVHVNMLVGGTEYSR